MFLYDMYIYIYILFYIHFTCLFPLLCCWRRGRKISLSITQIGWMIISRVSAVSMATFLKAWNNRKSGKCFNLISVQFSLRSPELVLSCKIPATIQLKCQKFCHLEYQIRCHLQCPIGCQHGCQSKSHPHNFGIGIYQGCQGIAATINH